MLMNDDIRALGTVLNILLFVVCFFRLHRVEVIKPSFVLYLCMTLAFGFLLIGDAGYWLPGIDLGPLTHIGSGIRFTMFRAFLLVGLLYVSLTGEDRKKGCDKQGSSMKQNEGQFTSQ